MTELKLDLIKKALEDKKAEDITILNVEDKTPFFTYYVIATIANTRQANACIEEIEENFEKSSIPVTFNKGRRETAWSLLDCGDILVHLFLKEERERISLEKLLEKSNSKKES